MPERLQRRRTAGWRAPVGAKYVGRGTRFGNPFVVGQDAYDRAHATSLYREWLEHNSYNVHPPNISPEQRQAMDDRRDWILEHAAELAGLPLMCWCPSDQACHADVLLELSNTKEADRA